jgi:6-phosphogluconolactonase (cycloisomerase 2 family)
MKTKFQALVGLAAVLLVVLGLSGCDHYVCSSGATFGASSCTASGNGLGSGNGGSTQTAFVFLEDSSAGQVAAEGLNVGSTGTFAPVAGFVPPQLPQPSGVFGGMAIVAKKYLYVSYSGLNGAGTDDLFAFSINPASGALTAIGTPIAIAGVSSVAADPKGLFVFVGGGTEIEVFSVNQTTGALTSAGTFPTGTGFSPSQMTTDGLGRFLYGIEGSSVAAYSYNSNGALVLVGSTFAPGLGLRQIAADKSGNFLLGITALNGPGATDLHVYVMGINASGSLTTPTANLTTDTPTFIAVSPTAENLYTFNTQNLGNNTTQVDSMQGFTIGAGGQLSGESIFNITAIQGVFDQSGSFIFADLADSNAATFTTPLAVASDGTVTTTNFGTAGFVSLQPFVVTDEP